ncbi:MAG TPA: N-acetyl-gamma-glutamyl-phosphate reductase [Chitinophagales bacterium]|nr:N-acetyl-gamma-glutamyl-phosphate reductase [Chitinophagales bacterium]
MKKIKAGIIGGAGYTGGELIRLLLLHPQVEIAFVQSNSNSGKPVSDIHADLLGETALHFSPLHQTDVDVLFLCGGHGAGRKLVGDNELPDDLAIIDLSEDFRHYANHNFKGRSFVYGLPELNREKIKAAKSIANPGCFATCIQLALLPLAAANQLTANVHVNATTGSTGAGQAPGATTHFSWRDSNLSVYKAFAHQHVKEITESLTSLQPGFNNEIMFIPQRGNFTRGILATAYLETNSLGTELETLYQQFYAAHPFVTISPNYIDLKQVVNTNRCFIHIEKHGTHVLITSVIDNLLKGASGQAVQNMNLIFGLDEKTGLQLKPSAF